MKRIPIKIFTLLLAGFSFQASAQNAFSLSEAVAFAILHNTDVMNGELDQQLNANRQHEVRGIGLPQISGSFDVKDYLDIPTSLIPSEFSGGPPGTYFPVKFGTQYNATAGINVSQIIFSSDYLSALMASKTVTALTQKNLQRTKIETTVQVTKAYYTVLVNRERIKLLDANIDRVKKLFEDTKVLFANGFVEQIDVDRVEVAYNNLMAEREKVAKLVGLTETVLKFQMGFDVTQPIQLKDSLDTKLVPTFELENGQKPDLNNRIEYSLLQSQRKLMDVELKRYKMQFLPSLVAYGSFSKNAQRQEFDFFKFDDQHEWYPLSIIGATLSVPIFSGGSKYYKLQQSKINYMILENNIKNLENALTLELSSTLTAYNNAVSSLTIQQKNLDLANRIFDVSKKKYDQGVGSNLEVINAQTSVREALTNYYNALFDYYIAKVDLDKSKGLIK